jgi:hypothetical protein
MSGADLARVQAHIDEALKHSRHLQELVARPSQAMMLSPEGQLADLQGHFNVLLQVLSRGCLNNGD